MGHNVMNDHHMNIVMPQLVIQPGDDFIQAAMHEIRSKPFINAASNISIIITA